MYTIGLSTNAKTINEELFIQYEKAGIGAMELAMTAEELDVFDFEAASGWAKAHNVMLWSLHLLFRPEEKVNIAALEDEVRKSAVDYHAQIIRKAAKYGIKIFVIHPNSNEPLEEDERRELRFSHSMSCLNTLSEIAHSEGAVLAVENLPRSCLARNSDELLKLLEANSKLRVCYDTNHLLEQEATEFIRAVGDKIVTLHVSDYDFINERHWLPGEGKVDWQSIVNTLREVGYNGVWMYEIRFACPNTIIRERDLNCNDFVKNAREIFENKPLTTFSKQKENLGMW